MSTTPTATLRASLERHNETFESLLKLIPAQYYFVDDMVHDLEVAQSEVDENDLELRPMPEAGGIEVLREKLHAKIERLRRGGRPMDGEAGDKDDLLEERRQQRAAMRERRRKETKEKIRREEEMKVKKMKGKEKDRRQTGNVAKVRVHEFCLVVPIF